MFPDSDDCLSCKFLMLILVCGKFVCTVCSLDSLILSLKGMTALEQCVALLRSKFLGIPLSSPHRHAPFYFSTCLEPSREFSAGLWLPGDILTWPICVRDTNANSTEKHLTCEVTSRPCCYGTQAICIITTPDHCDFLSGRFHQDAFLCSQVSDHANSTHFHP